MQPGEIVAMRATGSNPSMYIKKNDCVFKEKMIETEIPTLENFMNKKEYRENNLMENIVSGNSLPYEYHRIYNVRARVQINDFSVDFIDELLEKSAQIFIDGVCCSWGHISHILVLARLMGRELVEGYDYVDIPIILFDLLFLNGFPLNEIPNSRVCVSIGLDSNIKYVITHLIYDYEVTKEYKPSSTTTWDNVYQLGDVYPYPIMSNGMVAGNIFHLSNVAKLLFFDFSGYQVEPSLTGVTLYLNSLPIHYDVFTGEVICTEINDRKMYILSLTPEYETEDDLIKFFANKRTYRELGINFSRISSIQIKFHFDNNYEGMNVNISSLVSNKIFMHDGHCMLRYTK